MFSVVSAFFASCSDGSKLICRVTKEKWVAERRVPEGVWLGVRRPENAMNISNMGLLPEGLFWFLSTSDYCPQKSKVEKRSGHPIPPRQSTGPSNAWPQGTGSRERWSSLVVERRPAFKTIIPGCMEGEKGLEVGLQN